MSSNIHIQKLGIPTIPWEESAGVNVLLKALKQEQTGPLAVIAIINPNRSAS